MRKSWLAAPLITLGAVAAHDLAQRRHAILRNFPVVGHARYWLEAIGPELRQYIVAGNDEERPFSRDQRRWVYASAKLQNNYFGFGTDNDLEHTDGNVIVHHRTFGRAYPTHGAVGQEASLPSAKVLGGALSFPSVGMLRPRLRPLGITLDGLDDLIKRCAQRHRRALQFRQKQSPLDGC